jgi:hypothetical protein
MAKTISEEEFGKEMAHKREVIDMHFNTYRRTAEGAGYKVEAHKIAQGKAMVVVVWFAEEGKPAASLIEEKPPMSVVKDDSGQKSVPETPQDGEKRTVIKVFANAAEYDPHGFRGAEKETEMKKELKELRATCRKQEDHIARAESELTELRMVKAEPPKPPADKSTEKP